MFTVDDCVGITDYDHDDDDHTLSKHKGKNYCRFGIAVTDVWG
jgi:hypothetical protein